MKKLLVSLILFSLIPSVSSAAEGVLFFSPERGTYAIGDTFEVEVRANTDGVDANAAEADIVFNKTALEVERIEIDGSVLSLWPTPVSFSNEKGAINFSGTAPRSFNGANAMLIRIVFRAKSNVPGDVHMDSGALLLNDARATNIISTMRSALFSVTPRQTAPAPTLVATSTEPVTQAEPEVKGASIQVPAITGYDDRVSIGERIVLQGNAEPNSRISVFLQYEDDAPRESQVLTAGDGSFTYVAADLAIRGVYRAWASVYADSQQLSSDKVVMVARPKGFAAAAESITPMLTLALPYLLLLVAAGASLGYFYNRKRAATTSAFE